MERGQQRTEFVGKGRKRPAQNQITPSTEEDMEYEIEQYMDDEIEVVNKERDKISLDINDNEDASDEELEQPVFDLKGENSEESEELEGDNNEQLRGIATKIAKQANVIRKKTGGVEGEMEEPDEQEEEMKAAWGKGKKLCRNADNNEYEIQFSNEELLAGEDTDPVRLLQVETATQVINVQDMDASDAVRFCSATADVVKSKVEEQQARIYALEKIIEEQRNELNEFKSWSLYVVPEFSRLPDDTEKKTDENNQGKDELAKSVLRSVKGVIVENLEEIQNLLNVAWDMAAQVDRIQYKFVHVKNSIKQGQEADQLFEVQYIKPYLAYAVPENERGPKDLSNFQLIEARKDWEYSLRTLNELVEEWEKLDRAKAQLQKDLNHQVGAFQCPALFVDGALTNEKQFREMVGKLKVDFAKQFNSKSIISADDIKQWLIVASVNNAKLKEALENQGKVLFRIDEDLMEIMAKCTFTVGPFKTRIKKVIESFIVPHQQATLPPPDS
jgi:hypothetical protein